MSTRNDPSRLGLADPWGTIPPPRPQRFVRIALVFYGVLLLLALVWRVGIAGESLWFASAKAQASPVAPFRDIALGFSAALAVVGFSLGLTRYTQVGETLARTLARLLGPLEWRHCLALALASGIGEEAFFRGALQPRVGLLLASMLFGLAHFVPRRELASWSVFSCAAGFLLGVLFERTGTLLAPTVAHVTINALNLRLLVTRFGRRPA